MNNILVGITGIKEFVYLDDIIINAVTIEDHDIKLNDFFDRLRKFNKKIKPSKYSFMRKEVHYLGQIKV